MRCPWRQHSVLQSRLKYSRCALSAFPGVFPVLCSPVLRVYICHKSDDMADTRKNYRIVSVTDDAVLTAAFERNLDPSRPFRASVWQPDRNPLVWPDQQDIQEGSIAFHPVYGFITWSSWWRFSTENFIAGLKAADANPAISGHLIRVDSGGGEVFGCHEAFETVWSLSKPCVAVIDSLCGSAAYWLACGADRIYSSSLFSRTGSIGVMGAFVDDRKYQEMSGIEYINLYSSYSDLKNRLERDVLDGHPEEYISRMIDPVAEQFIADVRETRGVPEDSEALRGRMYYSADAIQEKLIDGQLPFDDAIDVLVSMLPEDTSGTDMQEIDINNLQIDL